MGGTRDEDRSHSPPGNGEGQEEQPAEPEAQAGRDASARGGEWDADDELAEAQREKAQFKALLQRVQADFVNYRKRVQLEQEDLRRTAKVQLVMRLLNVMDEFDAALGYEGARGVDKQWLAGVEAIRRNLESALASEGVERMPDKDGMQFDPHQHEALLSTPTSEYPAQTILRVLQPGYRMGEHVIRPARVEIASAPTEAEAGDPGG